MNWEGLYDPELIAHYGRRGATGGPVLRDREDGVLAGRHALATAARPALRDGAQPPARRPRLRRGARPVRRAGDAHRADPRPRILADDAPVAEGVARALEMIVNTAPTDVTGHPATSVPAAPPTACRSG